MSDEEEPEPVGASGMRSRWVLWIRRLVVLGGLLTLLGVGALAGAYWWFVLATEAPHLERDHILSVIAQESPVYYADGETKIGVFFSEEHRQYVPAAKLPEHYVYGLVSAEDRTFFTHHGFSPRGIARAMMQNMRAGRTVAGGSTLTQQTAKNLFERRGRTYREKLRELANSLRLEREYSKEEILEFYSNQFYVNGNGRGLGIAARFFFDAEVGELDLLQCAFLAGVVKSPNRYNPFVADEDRRERAIAAGRERVGYVLSRMAEDGWIDEATRDRESSREIPFRRGRFRFERSVVLDYVERELNSPEFRATLLAHGVDDPGRAGLRVLTTLDADLQREALYGLRHHLSNVGLWLESPELETLFGSPRVLSPLHRGDLAPSTFHTGLIGTADIEAETVEVLLGGEERGILDRAAHERLATALLRGRDKNTWVRAKRKDRKGLVELVRAFEGRTVSVSVRGTDESGAVLLDYDPQVKLDGATVVLRDGEVKAMVGGWRNVDFNRATTAKRQLGSTWKLVLFEAALQLGWAPTDPLDNRRSVFPYQSTFYYPRPDHSGAPEQVSIGWAAARSENLATIWLLDHLSDPLSPAQFRALAARVGLVPRKGESDKEWILRVQKAGVLPTGGRVTDGLFRTVWRDEITPDLLFEGQEEIIRIGASLSYGLGFDVERGIVERDKGLSQKERTARLATLDRSFLMQEQLAQRYRESRLILLERSKENRRLTDRLFRGWSVKESDNEPVEVSFGDSPPPGFVSLTRTRLERLLPPEPENPSDSPSGATDSVWDEAAPSGKKGKSAVPPTRGKETPAGSKGKPAGAKKEKGSFSPIGASGKERRSNHLRRIREKRQPGPSSLEELLAPHRVRLDGRLTPEVVERTRGALNAARGRLGKKLELYSFQALSQVRDFRLLVHLEYLRLLARRSGVTSHVTPVMSMPLGSSEITLMEASLLYQAMLTGRTHHFYPDALSSAPIEGVVVTDAQEKRQGHEGVSVVQEVRLADDTVIYRSARETSPLHSPGVAAELQGMLRAVVTHGTGRRASGGAPLTSKDDVRAKELASRKAVLPLFGKTGTTNSYKNSAFVGFVPDLGDSTESGATAGHLRWGTGSVIATYVGYDDNREMRNGGVRLAGASGSLPAWLSTARAYAATGDVGDRVDLVDLDFSSTGTLPLTWPEDVEHTKVDASTGLPLDGDGAESVATLVRRVQGGAFEPIAVGGP